MKGKAKRPFGCTAMDKVDGGQCLRDAGHTGTHAWPAPPPKGRVTIAKPVLDGTRCTAWNVTYGQCELEQAHGSDHQLHTPTKSLLQWRTPGEPITRKMDGTDCGAIARHGKPCILDLNHKNRHDNGEFTWADRRRSKKPDDEDDQVHAYETEFNKLNLRDADCVEIQQLEKETSRAAGEPHWVFKMRVLTMFAQRREAAIDKALGNNAEPPIASSSTLALWDRTKKLLVHPAAEEFPLIEGDDLESLTEDISANGPRHPIVLEATRDVLVDGRNRLRVCALLGIDPPYVRLDEDVDPIEYIVSTNLRRRHLTASQRAMIAAAIAKLGHGGDRRSDQAANLPVETQAEVAKRFSVSERNVRDAKRVQELGSPELVTAVKAGKVAVDAAAHVAKLPAGRQRAVLERVKDSKGEVKSGKLRALAKQEEKRAVVAKINKQQVPPIPIGKYGVLLVDPPWPFDNSDQHEGSRGHMPYPPMSIEAIWALNKELDLYAEKNCVLGLWIPNAFMHELGGVLDAWKFEHRTLITWAKNKMGLGSWARGITEHLVLASRGKPTHTLNEIKTLIEAPVREHSRKPDIFAELLAKHCPGPHLEMFAREERKGWTSWGAETRKFKAA